MKNISKISLLILVSLLIGRTYAQSDDPEARRAAFEACISETGVSQPQQGSRPSEEDRQKIGSCMTAKGFSKPEHRENSEFKAAMQACAQENGVSAPEAGQRPSDEDRQKMDSCLQTKGFSHPHRRSGGSSSRQ